MKLPASIQKGKVQVWAKNGLLNPDLVLISSYEVVLNLRFFVGEFGEKLKQHHSPLGVTVLIFGSFFFFFAFSYNPGAVGPSRDL